MAAGSWRARVGIVNPSRGDVLMYEYYAAAPPGVILVPAALGLQRLSGEELERVIDGYVRAVEELAYERVDLVVLGGTPPVTHRGSGFERTLVERASAVIDVPVVPLVRLEVEALQAIGARRIAVGAPYTPELTRKFADYFTAAGFEVAATKCLGIERPVEMAVLPPSVPAGLARAVRAEGGVVDAVHLTCPRWPTVASLARLEAECGVPVTSSSASVLYGTLARLGIHDRIAGFGSLLERLATTVPA